MIRLHLHTHNAMRAREGNAHVESCSCPRNSTPISTLSALPKAAALPKNITWHPERPVLSHFCVPGCNPQSHISIDFEAFCYSLVASNRHQPGPMTPRQVDDATLCVRSFNDAMPWFTKRCEALHRTAGSACAAEGCALRGELSIVLDTVGFEGRGMWFRREMINISRVVMFFHLLSL